MTDNQEKTFVRTARACGTREASTLTIRHPSLSASRASSRLRDSISSVVRYKIDEIEANRRLLASDAEPENETAGDSGDSAF